MGEKVSIIITNYNKSDYIKEAIESAINQTYKNVEVVIIDDCSTDNSFDLIQNYKEKYNNIVCIRNEQNRGVVYSRNLAINKASGYYILPLDADDIIMDTYVEKAVKVFEEKNDVDIVYSKVKTFANKSFRNLEFGNIYLDNYVTSSAVFRKSDFEKLGGYKDCMNSIGCEDWELWINFYTNNFKFYRINEYLFKYRQNVPNSRTTIQIANRSNIFKQLIKIYPDIYLQQDNDISINSENAVRRLQNKYKKYKCLFNILSLISIIELVLLVYVIIKKLLLL